MKRIIQKIKMTKINQILSVMGGLASIIGFFLALTKIIGIGRELAIALISVIISFFAGVFSMYIAKMTKKITKTHRIFLSYPHDSKDIALQISKILKGTGSKVWLDVENIKAGDSIATQVENAISNSDTFIAIITKQTKPNLAYELGLAKAKGLKIIPVMLEDATIPTDIQDLYYIDLRENKEKGFEAIVSATH